MAVHRRTSETFSCVGPLSDLNAMHSLCPASPRAGVPLSTLPLQGPTLLETIHDDALGSPRTAGIDGVRLGS